MESQQTVDINNTSGDNPAVQFHTRNVDAVDMVLLRKTILEDVLKHLPSVFKKFMLDQESQKTNAATSKPTKKLMQEVSVVQSNQTFLDNKIAGLSTKVDSWTKKIESLSTRIKAAETSVNTTINSFEAQKRRWKGQSLIKQRNFQVSRVTSKTPLMMYLNLKKN